MHVQELLQSTPFPASDRPFRFDLMRGHRDWDWVTSVLPVNRMEDTTGLIAVDSKGNYAAVCVMDSWTGSAVSVHLAILNPFVLKHGFMHELAQATFVNNRRSVVIGMVPANNHKALKFDKHLGFTELFRIKDGFDHGVDYVILEMRRENCRWIKGEKYDG